MLQIFFSRKNTYTDPLRLSNIYKLSSTFFLDGGPQPPKGSGIHKYIFTIYAYWNTRN
ncbi:MAG TPA: hypothetical protein DCZ94_12675 [Lentisphaeria bacterium]|nr:hypothetical protein [Lentisphaeria bacterium]